MRLYVATQIMYYGSCSIKLIAMSVQSIGTNFPYRNAMYAMFIVTHEFVSASRLNPFQILTGSEFMDINGSRTPIVSAPATSGKKIVIVAVDPEQRRSLFGQIRIRAEPEVNVMLRIISQLLT